MTRIALITCAALITASATPAFAGEAPRANGYGQRVVTMCERDPLTQTAFRSQHGARPVFVTADQVVTAAGERWTAPRCMTSREHQRLARMMNQRPSR